MLCFYCAAPADLPTLRREGLRALSPDRLQRCLPDCDGPILVIDTDGLTGGVVPPKAIPNLDPYLPPREVEAAGGYVMRQGDAGPEVLLIFRRGVWDLPKGKRDPGESIEACALREVREEVGICTLHLVQPLGTTIHGYERKGHYEVKTTHWYRMETPETQFMPQTEEDIERVAWVPWDEAKALVGYDTLRRHMADVEARVYTLRS